MASCNVIMFDKNASSFNHTYSIHIFIFYHDIHLKKVKMVILQTHIYKKKTPEIYILMPYESMIMRVYNGLMLSE